MAASAFDSGAERPSDERVAGSPYKPANPLVDRHLLESVLRETLASSTSAQPLAPGDWQALGAVITRHRGQPFAREPIVSDLVGALLSERLTEWGLSEPAQAEMSVLIADTLYDDIASRDRLRVLWERLCELRASETPT
jgi:hypothetical protein